VPDERHGRRGMHSPAFSGQTIGARRPPIAYRTHNAIEVQTDGVFDGSAWTQSMWLAAAATSEARSDFAGVSAGYHAALRLDPIGRAVLLGLARISARTMDHDTAIEWSRRAVDACPDGRCEIADWAAP